MKKNEEKESFQSLLQGVCDGKGLSMEAVVNALEESIVKAYFKYMGGKEEDGNVQAHVDINTGKIEVSLTKKVLKEADVQDDYVEISVEEANAYLKEKKIKHAAYKEGDTFVMVFSQEDTSKFTALAIRNNFRAKLAEAEKVALYKTYKSQIGEIVSATVDRSDAKTTVIKIGHSIVELSRRDLIGEETFDANQQIKVYIEEVTNSSVDGKPLREPQIQATRSSKGFIKRLFEEEIHEVLNGTVVIKGIVRAAGIRSKVAVISTKEDVDPISSCIGKGGERIRRVVCQLGNAKLTEKIDVLNYSADPAVYVLEASRPAEVLGVKMTEVDGKPFAYAVINDFRAVTGRNRINHKLAEELTGVTIKYISEQEAAEQGIDFIPTEQLKQSAAAARRLREKEAFAKRSAAEVAQIQAAQASAKMAQELAEEKAKQNLVAKKQAEKKTAAPKASKVEPLPKTPAVAPKASARAEEFPTEATNPALAALEAIRAAKAAEAVSSNENAEVETPSNDESSVTVKTTTTLSDLEKALENEPSKAKAPVKGKRPRKITEEEVKRDTPKPAVSAIPAYTEEELNEIEQEEAANNVDDYEDEEDSDYSQYDDYDGYGNR